MVSIRSAGVVIVHKMGEANRFLLLRAFGHWDFPKGVIESGEEPIHAACREVEEETGLKNLIFSWGFSFIETRPYGPKSRSKVARYYIAKLDPSLCAPEITLPICPELGKPENDEYRWVKYREAKQLLPPRLIPVINWAGKIANS